MVLAVGVLVPPNEVPGVLLGVEGALVLAVLLRLMAALTTLASPLIAARNVAANLVASAFFKYTTWMLPFAACVPG